MDPNATLTTILDAEAANDDRISAIDDLVAWLDGGGFTPRLARLRAPSFGGNTAARQWTIRKLEAMRSEIAVAQ